MDQNFQQDYDLFGDPVMQSATRRGRPAHAPTQKNRNKVIVLLALGWSNERIANAIHIVRSTLERHYSAELKARLIQRDRLVAWRFEKVVEAADTGNVAAIRELGQMIKDNDLMQVEDDLANRGKKESPVKLGKKEISALSAEDAEQEFEAMINADRVN